MAKPQQDKTKKRTLPKFVRHVLGALLFWTIYYITIPGLVILYLWLTYEPPEHPEQIYCGFYLESGRETAESDYNDCVECYLNGGDYGRPWCRYKTKDRGKKCTDSSQCEGYCELIIGTKQYKAVTETYGNPRFTIIDAQVTGQCSKFDTRLGCIVEVKNGYPEHLCYD